MIWVDLLVAGSMTGVINQARLWIAIFACLMSLALVSTSSFQQPLPTPRSDAGMHSVGRQVFRKLLRAPYAYQFVTPQLDNGTNGWLVLEQTGSKLTEEKTSALSSRSHIDNRVGEPMKRSADLVDGNQEVHKPHSQLQPSRPRANPAKGLKKVKKLVKNTKKQIEQRLKKVAKQVKNAGKKGEEEVKSGEEIPY